MSKPVTHVGAVVYDAAKRRFRGELHLNGTQVLVSAPGYPSWDFGRISKALSAKAAITVARIEGAHHAGS